jgi:hypothetical protein
MEPILDNTPCFRSLDDVQAAINRYPGEHNRYASSSSGPPIPTALKAQCGYQVMASNH